MAKKRKEEATEDKRRKVAEEFIVMSDLNTKLYEFTAGLSKEELRILRDYPPSYIKDICQQYLRKLKKRA